MIFPGPQEHFLGVGIARGGPLPGSSDLMCEGPAMMVDLNAWKQCVSAGGTMCVIHSYGRTCQHVQDMQCTVYDRVTSVRPAFRTDMHVQDSVDMYD